MDRAEALRVLGVPAEAGAADVRSAYLRLMRSVHPDVSLGDDGGALAVLVAEAYRVARSVAGATGAVEVAVEVGAEVDGDTLVLALPADEAFLAMLDAASVVGDVTYVDPEAGLLEAMVVVDGVRHSLVVTLQGRAATGTTEAFCTVSPFADGVVEALAAAVATFPP